MYGFFTALFISTLTFRNILLGLSVIQFTYQEKGVDNNISRLVSRTKIQYPNIWCNRSLTNAKYSLMKAHFQLPVYKFMEIFKISLAKDTIFSSPSSS